MAICRTISNKFKKFGLLYKSMGKNFEIIKEYDFDNDIDTDKSDVYIIDENNQSLEFLYSRTEELKKEQFINVLGEMKSMESEGVLLVPTVNVTAGDSPKRVACVTEESLNIKETDELLYIDFNCENKDMIFNVIISNRFDYELMKKFKTGEVRAGAVPLLSAQRVLTVFTFINSMIAIYKRIGIELQQNTRKVVPLKSVVNTKYIINFKHKYIYLINENRKEYFNIDSIQEKKHYVILSGETKESQGHVNLNSICYGKEEGYIYFMPIECSGNFDEMQVHMVCNRQPVLQFYSYKQQQWIGISDEVKAERGALFLRIKLKTGDKLQSLAITACKEEGLNETPDSK